MLASHFLFFCSLASDICKTAVEVKKKKKKKNLKFSNWINSFWPLQAEEKQVFRTVYVSARRSVDSSV